MSDLTRTEGAQPSSPAGLEQAREILGSLIADGQVAGPWSVEAVASFRVRCTEFIGEHGEKLLAELARLARENAEKEQEIDAMDSRRADEWERAEDAEARVETLETTLRDIADGNYDDDSALAGQVRALAAAALVGEQAAEPEGCRCPHVEPVCCERESCCCQPPEPAQYIRVINGVPTLVTEESSVVARSSENDDTRGRVVQARSLGLDPAVVLASDKAAQAPRWATSGRVSEPQGEQAAEPEHDENCWIACPHDTPPTGERSPVVARSSENDATRGKTVFAWLIERGQPERQAPTLWWAEEEDAHWGGWTTDAYKAVRFATKAEADEQIRVLSRPVGEPTMHASEHGFLPPGVLPADEPERDTNAEERARTLWGVLARVGEMVDDPKVSHVIALGLAGWDHEPTQAELDAQ